MVFFPFEALVAALISVFLFVQPIYGQEGGKLSTTVTNSDSGITYSPSYCNSTEITSCLGSWSDTTLSDGTVVKTSAGPSSIFYNAPTWLRYSFYGTKVDIHGLSDVQGSMLIVQLDGSMAMVNTSSGFNGTSMGATKLASMSSLDNDMIHSLSIGWCANRNTNASSGLPYAQSYAYFSHLNIDNFREANIASSSTSPSSSSDPSADTSSSGRSALSSTQKVAVAMGSIAGGLAIFIIIIVITLRRSRHLRFLPSFVRRWHRGSRDIEVIISSDSLQRADSILDYDFKARPHMSLPPSYATSSDGRGSRLSRNSNNAYLKSSKGLDLELEAIDDDPFRSDNATLNRTRSDASPASPQKDEKQLPILKSARQVGSKLRVVTRESVLRLGRVSRQPRTAELSAIPLTPFVVGTASIAQAQISSIVSAASTSTVEPPKVASSSSTKLRASPPPPPPPPKSISRSFPTSSEKKARRSKVIISRLPSPAWSQPQPTSSASQSDLLRTLPQAPPLPQAPLPVHPCTLIPSNERPSLSFDTFSITSRSVPPPYALYPM